MKHAPIVRTLIGAAVLAASFAWPTHAQAPTDVRVALVIGNAAYPGTLALSNPKNDATAMAETLRRLGFTVLEVKDGTRAQMDDAVKKLFGTLKGRQGIGMLYYAGHGLQVDWKNYMVPVDAKLQSSKDVVAQTVDVGDVIEALKLAQSRMNIIVLDACRDNPFAEKGAKGLAPVDAPPSTLLAYATAPGNVAEDGNGQNGLYTKHLLAELSKPVSIENVFKRVRFAVRRESNGRQIPWESTSLEDDFSFAAKKDVPAITRGAQRDADYAEQKAAWDQIKTSTNPNDYLTFLEKYPSGLIAEVAQSKLEMLGQAKVAVQSTPGKPGMNPTITDTYRVGDEWVYKERIFAALSGSTRELTFKVIAVERGIATIEVVSDDFFKSSATSKFQVDGGLISTRNSILGTFDFDPALPLKPSAPLQTGYRSSSRTTALRNGESRGTFDSDLEVLGQEQVNTPAGNFNTYKVKVSYNQSGIAFGTNKLVDEMWYSPEHIIPVKKIHYPESAAVSRITYDLLRLKRGPIVANRS